MQQWIKISLMLCTFGFLKEIRPSESFIVDYLAGPWRNITLNEVVQEAFPIGTYSYLAQLAIIFLITDLLRYKPLIVVNGLAGVIVWSMLIWTTSLNALKILEVFYGTYCAAEIAYYSYIYAKVDREHYQKVTSHTRAAIYSGKCFAGVLAQILVYFEAMDYKELNYLSLAAQVCATVWALFLPSVSTSMYFHRAALPAGVNEFLEDNEHDDNGSISYTNSISKPPLKRKVISAFVLIWMHFKTSFTNLTVLEWSIWYALAMAGYIQIIAYVQALWSEVDPNQKAVWNAAVEATVTLLAAIVSLLAGYIHSSFLRPRTSLFALSVLALGQGGAMMLASTTSHLIVSYLGYMVFSVLYAFTITVVSAEIAKNISDDSFGLVLGFNTLVALSLQTVLTFAVTDADGWYALDVFGQFIVYSYYFVALSAIYLIFLLCEMGYSACWRKKC
ncbi:thiamine transporter 1-like [Topomyia yanbarensis]|uniref:thiamine transporter 1-like n=1 Tax=Topomyia yanbarensis TaxID=2498891 RepID=UPI00273C5951|nr:thiamine transporter 1-like [Topomyia yanbarensis]XP_058823143.1 thiamine transporter 1-like [Topomyia yanbarensis]XP_058823186.1 thiamine transporter 1-like [Topomyia yanbarensis]